MDCLVSDATLRIKNLSIALEALSHGPKSRVLRDAVEILLHEQIKAFREEKEKENQWPPKPTKPALRDPYQDDV